MTHYWAYQGCSWNTLSLLKGTALLAASHGPEHTDMGEVVDPKTKGQSYLATAAFPWSAAGKGLLV